MGLARLFDEVLNAEYIHLEEETASFAYKVVEDELMIFFQWSNGATDWKNNFDFPAKPYRDMKDKWYAHRGFLRVWKVIEPHLKPYIMSRAYKYITVAGYSHGAALALLCHEYCTFNRPDAYVSGCGFGCPRVVWGLPNKRVQKRFIGFQVIRCGCDLVTHLPPAIFGFRHVGYLRKIGQGEGYGPIESHRQESYIEALEDYEREVMRE